MDGRHGLEHSLGDDNPGYRGTLPHFITKNRGLGGRREELGSCL